MRPLKTLHLFAGAGGGLLADLILGHDPICAVEWDAYCCQVLRERAAEGWFPNLQVFEGDVRLFNASDWKGRVDCIHAGFPCQDISVAGNRAGVGDETRSGLYREVLRVADVVRPRFLFLENVSAILHNGLGTVLGDLAARGYDARWCCLRASDVGANHRRDRWWLLAYPGGQRLEGRKQHEASDARRPSSHGPAGEFCEDVANAKGREIDKRKRGDLAEETGGWEGLNAAARPGGKDVANAAGRTRQRETPREAGHTSLGGKNMADPPGVHESLGGGAWARREGFTNGSGRDSSLPVGDLVDGLAPCVVRHGWWEAEPGIGRVTKKEESRVAKLKALGNGQVPIQAATAFKILMEAFR